MADMTPVGNTIIPPNPMTGVNTLSGILGIKQQKQALQIGGQQLQQEQIKTQQQQGVQNFFNSWDPTQHLSPDGTTDADSVHDSPAYKNAGNAKPLIDQQLLQIKQGQLQNKQALSTLDDNLISRYATTMGTLANDPDVKAGGINGQAKVAEALQNFNKLQPEAARVGGMFGKVLTGAPKEEDGTVPNLAHLVQSQQLMGADVIGQRSQQNRQPVTVGTGSNTQFGARDPVTGEVTMGSGTPVPAGIPPGWTMTEDPITHNKFMINQQTGESKPLGQRFGGGSGSGSASSNNAPPQRSPGEGESQIQATKDANAHVESIRQADNPLDYGNNMQIANQIRKLSRSTDTGPGTETWHHVLGALGAPVGANNVADYQLLGAYLDRQAAGIRGAMGLPQTNEGGAQSREIAGNVTYQAKALQDKNDLTQALTEGLHQYREGLDRIAGFSGQASPNAVNQFKAAWTRNFDPNVYKGELAYQRSKADGDAFVKLLSPEEAASLSAKRKALQTLSSGQLPQ